MYLKRHTNPLHVHGIHASLSKNYWLPRPKYARCRPQAGDAVHDAVLSLLRGPASQPRANDALRHRFNIGQQIHRCSRPAQVWKERGSIGRFNPPTLLHQLIRGIAVKLAVD